MTIEKTSTGYQAIVRHHNGHSTLRGPSRFGLIQSVCEELERDQNGCEFCGGLNGEHQDIEILGDAVNFEVDVIGYRSCPKLVEETERAEVEYEVNQDYARDERNGII